MVFRLRWCIHMYIHLFLHVFHMERDVWFYHVVIIFNSLFHVACSRNSSNLQPASLLHLVRPAGKSEAQRPALQCEQCSGSQERRGVPLKKQNPVVQFQTRKTERTVCHSNQFTRVQAHHDAHWRWPEDRPLRFEGQAAQAVGKTYMIQGCFDCCLGMLRSPKSDWKGVQMLGYSEKVGSHQSHC